MSHKIFLLSCTFLFSLSCEKAADSVPDGTVAKENEKQIVPVLPKEDAPLNPGLSPSATVEDERNTIYVFDTAAPSTVFVKQKKLVRQRFTAKALEVPSGSGSGFIWDTKGHIVTNAHVVEGARKLTVTLLDGGEYDATLVGGDIEKDIAVIKINPKKRLIPVSLPTEMSKIKVGSKALAIGNPFGLDHTLTVGIISATGREVKGFGDVTIRDMLQTDAAINPGNSGGPLLNSNSELIGMNTMIFSKSGSSAGVGFAVPVSSLRRVVPQIIQHGKPLRAGLGVNLIPDTLAKRNGIKGVIIESVRRNTPAFRAGLKGLSKNRYGELLLGDIIINIAGFEIKDFDTLYNALDRFKPGDVVEVKVQRAKTTKTVKLKLMQLL